MDVPHLLQPGLPGHAGPVKVGAADGGGAKVHVHTAQTHGMQDFRRIAKDAKGDAGKAGPARQEEVRIAHQTNGALRREGFQHERA